MQQNLTELTKQYDWMSRWAGSYTFISCSIWGWEYYNSVKEILGTGLASTVFIHKEGTASCYLPKNELQRIADEIGQKVTQDTNLGKNWLGKVKTLTDQILPKMREQESIPTWEDYKKFLDLFDEFLAYHVFMKELVDFMPTEVVEKLEKEFFDAREYSMDIYSQSERYFRSVMKAVGEKEKINPDFLTCFCRGEFEQYLKQDKVPDINELEKRFGYSAIVYDNDKEIILTGDDAKKIDDLVAFAEDNISELKGTVAFPGKVSGVCRIVPDPFKYDHFNNGDILITGMTRPEFIPVMKMASAFVTDSGGMLCHAAITAREMKKPCIIGTEIATKVFKDGDMIEVDADTGIVKKISK